LALRPTLQIRAAHQEFHRDTITKTSLCAAWENYELLLRFSKLSRLIGYAAQIVAGLAPIRSIVPKACPSATPPEFWTSAIAVRTFHKSNVHWNSSHLDICYSYLPDIK
jgi:hypothetical protein